MEPGEGSVDGPSSPTWPDAVAVVSPHFDDAVLSCGQLLAGRPGSHVVTVFSEGPRRVRRLPAWDRMSAMFNPGDDVVGIRRAEDDAALALLEATSHRLGLWDSQYRRPFEPPRRWQRHRRDVARAARLVAERLAPLVESLGVPTWLMPLGLVHHDHLVTAAACLDVATQVRSVEWIAYEELPYGAERAELVERALAALAGRGLEPRPSHAPQSAGADAKRRAVACYRSQWTALGDRAHLVLDSPEHYHRLVRSGVGTHR